MNARIAAPELSPSLDWVNTDAPPTLAALRGRVTVLNFWTFDCVNCRNVLPDLRYLENKYHDGLSVIGVHTPKFEYQRRGEPVLKAVNRNHIRHPVANDPDYLMWQAYGVDSWPTLAVIDAQGQLAALLPGEGRRQEADTLIAHLLDEAAAQDRRVYESDVAALRPEPRTSSTRTAFSSQAARNWPLSRIMGNPRRTTEVSGRICSLTMAWAME